MIQNILLGDICYNKIGFEIEFLEVYGYLDEWVIFEILM